MSDEETRLKRSKKFRNPVAKYLNEHRGAFASKVYDVKLDKQKQKKINTKNYEEFNEDE